MIATEYRTQGTEPPCIQLRFTDDLPFDPEETRLFLVTGEPSEVRPELLMSGINDLDGGVHR